MTRPSRFHRLIDATSQWFNVLLFDGDANYSISGDAYRLHRPRLRAFIDALMARFEADHCRNSYLADVQRARQLIDEHDNGYLDA